MRREYAGALTPSLTGRLVDVASLISTSFLFLDIGVAYIKTLLPLPHQTMGESEISC